MTSSSKIDSLKKKRDTINARIKLLQNREQLKERKADTRRKILLGSYYLDQAKQNDSYDDIVKLMDSYLTRTSDRALFDLEPLEK